MNRSPDQILSDLDNAVTGNSGREVMDLVHEIIEDIQSSYRLALESDGVLNAQQIDALEQTVGDYVANHYSE